MTSIHENRITHNLILILSNWKGNQNLFNNHNFTTFIQLSKLIRSIMLNSVQIQFLNKNSTSNVSTTFTINNHITHLITNMTSNMKGVLSLLLLYQFHSNFLITRLWELLLLFFIIIAHTLIIHCSPNGRHFNFLFLTTRNSLSTNH
jgi:hypothetical protein